MELVCRIVDVADDLSFALFAYSGAAAVAGQAYVGAVLCTPDGEWPRPELSQRVDAALERAGVKPWELFKVRQIQVTWTYAGFMWCS
jgi:hypothetical protein